MRKILLIGINVLMISSILSCDGYKSTENINCINPVVEFAYPTGFSEPIESEKEIVLPLSPWERQISLFDNEDNVSVNMYSLISRNRIDESSQIWISYSLGEEKFIAYYDIFSRKINTFNKTDLSYSPKFIFSNESGNIWGVASDDVIPKTIYFVHFNDLLKDFEIVSEKFQFGDITAIARSKNDIYWISFFRRDTQSGNKIYTFVSYDSKTSSIQTYPEISLLQPSSLSIAPDNKVWMIVYIDSTWKLSIFDPVLETISIFQSNQKIVDGFVSEEINSLSMLYFDQLDRLWVDDRGWFDFSSTGEPQWYKVIRSPVFIEQQDYSEIPYIWRRPFFVSQSSNGLYWFNASVGTIGLNESTGIWCHFTTAISPVVEDTYSNLWIMAYGKLYRYSMQE